jgi:hypothetical protein
MNESSVPLNSQEPRYGFETKNETGISLLFDSQYYFLDTVFILPGSSGFRLVVLHKWKVLKDEHYTTLEEAKGSFYREYRDRGYKSDLQPDWHDNHPVDNDWLHGKLEIAGRHPFLNYTHWRIKSLYKKFICRKILK